MSFRPRLSLFAALAVVGSGTYREALAQTAEIVHSSARCPKCLIDRKRILRVGSKDDSVSYFLDRLSIARDSRGMFYVGPRWPTRNGEFAIDVYESSGERVRSIAKEGSGPGVVSGLYAFLMLPGDSVLVFGSSRTAILTASGHLARYLNRVPGRVNSAVSLDNGRLFVATPVPSAGRLTTLHLVSRDSGEVVSSFGTADQQDLSSDYGTRRTVSVAHGGTLWSARVNRYEIDAWHVTGKRMRTFSRSAGWFRPWSQDFAPERGPGRLQPHLVGIDVDSSGRLWVLINVPKDRSVQTPRSVPNASQPGFFDELYDTIVEVIEPATAHLLASQRFAGALRGFYAGQTVAAISADTTGTPQLDVYELSLRIPNKED